MESERQRRWRMTNADAVAYLIIIMLALSFSSIQLSSIQKNEIIRDNPECILQLKQDYCQIFNMTYGSKVMMTGLLSKNAQTIEICYDNTSEFRIYRSDIDVYACEDNKFDETIARPVGDCVNEIHIDNYERRNLSVCIDDNYSNFTIYSKVNIGFIKKITGSQHHRQIPDEKDIFLVYDTGIHRLAGSKITIAYHDSDIDAYVIFFEGRIPVKQVTFFDSDALFKKYMEQ